ncbi:MAG: aminotransferase class I/II-fold pyridoxal phosphate-dependent enzyme, partial [Deltaproteobacteria bacterium]|nr:aminotransferase class I/II-fold pyridoxal phosphate-dependent enzyme [Deltaproteobacteria bacterium]
IFGYPLEEKILERASAHWMKTRFDWPVTPEMVTFSPSVVTSLAFAIDIFTQPGDQVCFFTPTYPPFFRVVRTVGRVITSSSLGPESYQIDFDDLEKKLSAQKTRLFFLCNPHNPTGRVFTRDELLKIGELCLKHNVLMLSDEIHCDFVFPNQRGAKHLPFSTLSKELAHITLTTISPSKTFNLAGLYASAVISSNPGLLYRFSSAVAKAAVHPSSFGLLGVSIAYTECADYADQLAVYIRKNQEYAVKYINEHIPGLKAYLPEGSFLLWINCAGLCKELGGKQDQLVKFFLTKAKVALNSGTDFGEEGHGFMRMNTACPLDTIKEGLNRIEQAVKSL